MRVKVLRVKVDKEEKRDSKQRTEIEEGQGAVGARDRVLAELGPRRHSDSDALWHVRTDAMPRGTSTGEPAAVRTLTVIEPRRAAVKEAGSVGEGTKAKPASEAEAVKRAAT